MPNTISKYYQRNTHTHTHTHVRIARTFNTGAFRAREGARRIPNGAGLNAHSSPLFFLTIKKKKKILTFDSTGERRVEREPENSEREREHGACAQSSRTTECYGELPVVCRLGLSILRSSLRDIIARRLYGSRRDPGIKPRIRDDM